MELLNEAHISSYCHDQDRAHRWATAEQQSEIEPPAYVVPMFELFRAIHFGARQGGLNVSGFRDCWVDMVENQSLRGLGSLVRLLETNTCPSNNLPRDVWAHCALSPEDKATARQDDGRQHVTDPIPFRVCCQKFSNLHFESIRALPETKRKWHYDLPNEIPPTREPPGPFITGAAESVTGDLVLDTNIFAELLNDLPESGILETRPCRQSHVARALERIRSRFLAPLRNPIVSPGKLFVPVSVLIETYGVVYVKDPMKYAHARTIMDIMRHEGDAWRLWAAFDFEDWSLDVLGAHLTLYEALVEHEPDRSTWPSFTDALVLAHGIRNRCPVASAEWIDKDDWEPVRRVFPWLRGW